MDNNMMSSFFTEKDASFTRPNLISDCGKSFVHGDVNSIGMYPFVARIGFKSKPEIQNTIKYLFLYKCEKFRKLIIGNTGEIKYPCNGVILNQHMILTTASCALAKSSNYQL
ncbi:hypothetical protein K0M31_011088 [Melipona bicolor]|uniref:Peptidase S1 domain-containing protein n=1 Tax=Melipona bicolor TaxID=60889 RepID=A0AA40GA38_9HYME|nr:hypothetical protein K0M31_011088 [Melipona bicolor]